MDNVAAGDSQGATDLLVADDQTKEFVRSLCSLERAASKLKESATIKLGDTAGQWVDRVFQPHLNKMPPGQATVIGDTAAISSPDTSFEEVHFIRCATGWKVMRPDGWTPRQSNGKKAPIGNYSRYLDTAAYECYRVRDLLGSGDISTLPDLRHELTKSIAALITASRILLSPGPATTQSAAETPP